MADFNAMFGDSDDEDFYGFEPDNLSDSEGEEDDDEIELEDLAELVSGRQPQFTWTEELSPVDVPAFTQNVGPIDMPTNSTSPLSFFNKLFLPRIIQFLVVQTNLFMVLSCVRYDPNVYDSQGNFKTTSYEEMSAFLAVIILMGIVKLPSLRLYWSQDPRLQQAGITSVFPRQRFETLLRYFHCFDPRTAPDTNDPYHDKLFRVRPIIDPLDHEFAVNYNPSRFMSIDEAMVRYKGRIGFLQYMPNKPTKWGIKIFCLCDSTNGYLSKFIIYTGKVGEQAEKNLSSNIVCDLTLGLQGRNYFVFMDNWFSNLKMFKVLAEKGIYCCGTLRANRTGFPPALKDLKLPQQGDSKTVQDNNLVVCAWRDKSKQKNVVVASTMCQPTGRDMVRRKKKGADGKFHFIDIPQPPSVKIYNKYMGGVDLSDQQRTYYTVGARRSKKWWKYVFFFLLDVSIINSFILYKKTVARPLNHLEYRLALAKELVAGFSARPTTTCAARLVAGVDLRGHVRTRMQEGGPVRNCKNCQKRKARLPKDHPDKRPKQSRFGCAVCGVYLCDPNAKDFADWHRRTQPH